MSDAVVVVVTWTDANSMREQVDRHEALDLGTPTVHTFGILLEDTPERIVVVGELIEEDHGITYRNTTVIPRGMVRRVHALVPAST